MFIAYETTCKFLPRDAIQPSYNATAGCPSVRASVTSRYSMRVAKHIVMQTTLHDNRGLIELYFLGTKELGEILMGHPH